MEHKIIRGGQHWLPFARSRIKALKATGQAHASQNFTLPDGATVKVRVTPVADYIEIDQEPMLMTAFSGVQYPEPVASASITAMKGAPGGKLMVGPFPETEIDSSWAYPVRKGRSEFGASPYSAKVLRLSQLIEETGSSVVLRWGVSAGAKGHLKVFYKGVLQESIDWASPFTSYTNDAQFSAEGRSVEYIPVVNSSGRAIIATVEADAAVTSGFTSSTYPVTIGGATQDSWRSHGVVTQSGSSRIRLRILSDKTGADGATSPFYRTISVGAIPYADSYAGEFGPAGPGGEFDTGFNTVKSILDLVATNDVQRRFPNRRWHAEERVSMAPDGSVWVVRETGTLVYRSVGPVEDMHGVKTITITASATRALSVSFVSPDDVVMDHVHTQPLGAHGYIAGIITSADSKKAYIYYGLHDASEARTDPSDDYSFIPLQFTEYLDVIEVTQQGGAYALTKTQTISLGAVTLRGFTVGGDGGPLHQTDHYASKLRGAGVERNSLIWSDRFCYDLKSNQFTAIPDYLEYSNALLITSDNMDRDTVTGADDNRSSYLGVSVDGRSATYFLFKVGLVIKYQLGANSSGTPAVKEVSRFSVTGGFIHQEWLTGIAAQFKKPTTFKITQ